MTHFIPIIIVLFSIFILIHFEIKRECSECRMKNVYLYTNKISKDISFLFLSDFHNSDNKNVMKHLKNVCVNDDKIKNIISGGDMVTYSPKRRTGIRYNNFIQILEIFKKYKKNFYYGYGNHENRFGKIGDKFFVDISEYNKFNKSLKKYNIYYINEPIKLGSKVFLYEIRLPYEFYKKNINYKKVSHLLNKNIIKKYVGNIDKKNFNIIICHNPTYAENLIDYGFDLVLSGHFHGGLVQIPFIGALFTPEANILHPYNKGLYQYKNGNILVSNGLGEHTIKIRLNNIPEMYKVNIVKKRM